jgi:hypothetical protein
MAMDDLGFGRDRPELSLDFQQSFDEEVVGHGLAVVKPPGQEDFETPKRSAHMWLVHPQ